MANYGYTFTSGDTVTPTKLNNARTVSDIVNADIANDTITNAKIKSDAAIALSKLQNATGFGVIGKTANAIGSYEEIPAAGDGSVLRRSGASVGFGQIVDAGIASNAAIAGTKIAPNFGSQNVATTGTVSSKNLAVYGATNNDFAVRVTNTGTTNAYGFIVDGVNSPFALAVRDAANQYRFIFGGDGTASMGGALGNALNINASGNVGIGTTSPTFKFVAAGGTQDGGWIGTASTTSTLGLGGYNDGGLATFQIAYSRSSGAATFSNGGRDTPTERMRIDASGNVGIGTSSPSAKTEISTAAAAASALKITDATNYTLTAGYSASGVGYFGGDVGSALALTSNGSERLRLKATGQLRFKPLSADPAGAESGDVYYNSSTNKLRVYNGTSWVDLH